MASIVILLGFSASSITWSCLRISSFLLKSSDFIYFLLTFYHLTLYLYHMNDTLSTTKEKEVIWEENHSTELTQKSENKIASEAISSMLITETDSAKNGCKNIGKISGIYKIINKVNNKYYVGSSNDVKKRWREHRGELKKKIHVNDIGRA